MFVLCPMINRIVWLSSKQTEISCLTDLVVVEVVCTVLALQSLECNIERANQLPNRTERIGANLIHGEKDFSYEIHHIN